MLVCGDRECGSGTVSVRERGMKDRGSMGYAEFAEALAAEAKFPPL